MGVADRDWYSDRQRRGGPSDFWPPRRLGWNSVIVAIVLVALFLVGTKVDRWLTERQAAGAATRSSERTRFLNRQTATQPQLTQPVEREVPPAFAPPAAVRTVSKCIVNGQVTYSDNCTGLAVQSVIVEAGDGPAAPGLTAYQREMLRSADARIARDAAAARADTMARQQAYVSNRGQCAALSESARSLDAWSRQPLSGYQQDDIRRQKREINSQQFALRC